MADLSKINSNKVIDIVPSTTLDGDFLKLDNYNIGNYNSEVQSVMNIIMMEENTHPDYPEMGARNLILDIYKKEYKDVYSIISKIENMIKQYTGLNATIEFELNKANPEIIDMYITINGIKQIIKADIKNNKYARFIPPESV